jgi:uncharacterized membrane protein
MWKNVVQSDRPLDDNIIRRMRFACWVTKVADTHTLILCNAYCFSTATVVTRTRLNVTLYVSYIVDLVTSEGYKRKMAEFRKHSVFVHQLRILCNNVDCSW